MCHTLLMEYTQLRHLAHWWHLAHRWPCTLCAGFLCVLEYPIALKRKVGIRCYLHLVTICPYIYVWIWYWLTAQWFPRQTPCSPKSVWHAVPGATVTCTILALDRSGVRSLQRRVHPCPPGQQTVQCNLVKTERVPVVMTRNFAKWQQL